MTTIMDQLKIDARRSMVARHALKYGIDIAMICAVIEQESEWNQWTMRYEPAFFDRYVKNVTNINTTESIARATSYGLMQVMGQTARELGFTGKFLSELCDPEVGIEYGSKKLQACFLAKGTGEPGLLAYNGGGNQQYGRQVLARVVNYEV